MGDGFGFVVETKQNLIEISRLQKIRETSHINYTQVGFRNNGLIDKVMYCIV